MGMKYKTVGGQPTGVGKQFSDVLSSFLTGSYGAAGATGQAAGGVAGVLNDMLSGGAGKLGGALQTMIGQQETSDVNALRSRFGAGGGAAFGTPAAYAESTYRSTVAPQETAAIGNLQMSALSQLLPLFMNMYNKSTPQAENVGVQNPFVQGLGMATNLFSAINPFGSHSSNYDPNAGGSPATAGATPDFGSSMPSPSFIPTMPSSWMTPQSVPYVP